MEHANESSLFEQLGGEAGIGAWVDRFYDRIAAHPLLAPLFPDDLGLSKEKQAAFFVQFFGGPPRYNERFGQPWLRYRHRHVRIGPAERDAWLSLALEALREGGAEAALVEQVEARLAPMAENMVNHHPEKRDSYYFN